MRTLLIDNGSNLTEKLRDLIPGEVNVVQYDAIPDSVNHYSLIILSGSSRFPIEGHERELAAEEFLIRNSDKPIIGICLGHEIIAHAFGAKIELLGKHTGLCDIAVTKNHLMFQARTNFTVYEHHQYGITELPSYLEELARSDHAIAVFKHKEKPIYGFQFHPEHHTESQFGDEIFLALVKELIPAT